MQGLPKNAGVEMQTLTTQRLELQPIELKHADRLFELFQDVGLYEFIEREPPPSQEKYREIVSFWEGRESKDKKRFMYDWIGVDKISNEIVSFIEITIYRETHFCNLAYYTFQKHQKKGMAKESCRAVIDHLFSDLNVQKVIIEMDILNSASVRLAESLGATRVDFKPKAETIRGRWSDVYVYELVRNKPQ